MGVDSASRMRKLDESMCWEAAGGHRFLPPAPTQILTGVASLAAGCGLLAAWVCGGPVREVSAVSIKARPVQYAHAFILRDPHTTHTPHTHLCRIHGWSGLCASAVPRVLCSWSDGCWLPRLHHLPLEKTRPAERDRLDDARSMWENVTYRLDGHSRVTVSSLDPFGRLFTR